MKAGGVARAGAFCHDPRRSREGNRRLVAALSIWQVFMVLVIAGLIVLGGGLAIGRSRDGAGR
jgi:hypothetical protein